MEEEQSYFYRLVNLVYDMGTEVLLKFFLKNIPVGQTVEQFLKSKSVSEKLKNLKTIKVLNETHFKLINEADEAKFDISLLYVLIRNFAKIPAPTNGWDTACPAPSDKSAGAFLINLKSMRNEAVAHRPKAALKESEFEKFWKITEEALVELAGEVGNQEKAAIQQKITEAKSKPFLGTESAKLDALLKWDMEERFSNVGSKLDAMKEQIDKQNVTEEIGSLKSVILEMKDQLKSLGVPNAPDAGPSSQFQSGQIVTAEVRNSENPMGQQVYNLENTLQQQMQMFSSWLNGRGGVQTLPIGPDLPQITNPGALSADEITDYSSELGANWEIFAIYLGYKQAQIDTLKNTYVRQIEPMLRVMIEKWHDVVARCDDENPRKLLAAAFSGIRDNLTASTVLGDRKMLKEVKNRKPNKATDKKIKKITFATQSQQPAQVNFIQHVNVYADQGNMNKQSLQCDAEGGPNQPICRGLKRGNDDYGDRDSRKSRRDHYMTDDGRSKYSPSVSTEPLDTNLPPEILRMDEGSRDLYLKALEKGKTAVHSIRVMVVGHSEAGKTTLTKNLLGEKFTIGSSSRTEGIDVHVERCHVDKKTGDWDVKAKGLHEDSSTAHLTKVLKEQAAITSSNNDSLKYPDISGSSTSSNNDSLKYPERSGSSTSSDIDSSKTPATDSCLDVDSHPKPISDGAGTSSSASLPSQGAGNSVAASKKKADNEIKSLIERNNRKDVPVKDKDKYADLSIWDFAGQEEFYGTHQIFLSPESVYLLVIDLSKTINTEGEKRMNISDCVEFWLKCIHFYTKKEKMVILVGTHVDKLLQDRRKENVDKFFDDLRSKLGNKPYGVCISGYDIEIDNSNVGINLKKIKEAIFEVAKSNKSHWGELKPVKWLILEQRLHERRLEDEKIIERVKLEEENASLSVPLTEEELDLFLKFQHACGLVLYYSEQGLKDYVILDPQWLIDAFKCFITADEFMRKDMTLRPLWDTFNRNAVLTQEFIDARWTKDGKFSAHKEHLLLMMEKLNIIAKQITDGEKKIPEGSYFTPCVLKKDTPRSLVDTTSVKLNSQQFSTHKLCYTFVSGASGFVPPAIFHRLIAECMSKWRPRTQGKEILLFRDSAVFNLNESGTHSLTLYLCDDYIQMWETKYAQRKPEVNMKYRKQVESILTELPSNCSKMDLKTYIKCPKTDCCSSDGMFELSRFSTEDKICCTAHESADHNHLIQSEDVHRHWLEVNVMFLGVPSSKIGQRDRGERGNRDRDMSSGAAGGYPFDETDRAFRPKFAEPKKPVTEIMDRNVRDWYDYDRSSRYDDRVRDRFDRDNRDRDLGSGAPGDYPYDERDSGLKRGNDDYGDRDSRRSRRDHYMTDDGRSKYSASVSTEPLGTKPRYAPYNDQTRHNFFGSSPDHNHGNFAYTQKGYDLLVEGVDNHKLIVIAEQSICRIQYGEKHGSGFRIGPPDKNLILTANHILERILNCYENSIYNQQQVIQDVLNLSRGDVFCVFNHDTDVYHPEKKDKFFFEPVILFQDPETDTAILELKPNAFGTPMPSSFTSFCMPDPTMPFCLIGHPKGGKKKTCKIQHIFNVQDPDTREHIARLRDWCGINGLKCESNQYHCLDNPKRWLFHVTDGFMHGASGSPGLVINAREQTTSVATVFLGGYPEFFYDGNANNQHKEEVDKRCWRVEQGADIRAVHDNLKTQNEELYNIIFQPHMKTM